MYRQMAQGWYARVPPIEKRQDILRRYHEARGHAALRSMHAEIRREYWWPSLLTDCTRYVAGCRECQIHHPNRPASLVAARLPMLNLFEQVDIDIIHLPTSDEKYKYVICATEPVSRWCWTQATKVVNSKILVQFLVTRIIPTIGYPLNVKTDRASNLTQAWMKWLAAKLKFKQIKTSAYHPESNGHVERLNGTLKRMLAKTVDQHKRTWPEYLMGCTLAYNTKVHSATGHSPFFLLFGTMPRIPESLEREDHPIMDVAKWEAEAFDQVLSARERDYQIKRLHACRKQAYQQWNEKVSDPTPASWEAGDLVWVHRSHLVKQWNTALEPRWAGPYQITHFDEATNTARVEALAGSIASPKQDSRIHADRLKGFKPTFHT